MTIKKALEDIQGFFYANSARVNYSQGGMYKTCPTSIKL
jgi:hypothetical protein